MDLRAAPVFVRLFLLCLALASGARDLAADETKASDLYVRRKMDLAATTHWLAEEAQRIDASQVVFVLDLVTFVPPPGETEFTAEYAFFDDLDRWVKALEPWGAERPGLLRATTSLAPKTVEVGTPGWQSELKEVTGRTWWEDESFSSFEPADRWMQRLLARLEDAPRVRSATGPRMLVLVTGFFTPERWVPLGTTEGYESEWRTKFLPVGEYWKPGDVATVLDRQRATLYVVAPEARFGEFTPVIELPDAPWAARPQYPGVYGSARSRESATESPDLSSPEARRAVEEALRRALGGGLVPPTPPGAPQTTPGEEPPPPPSIESPRSSGLRYQSTTPVWFDPCGSVYLTTNHAPSAYGLWPLARTAARSGGRYLFYPFPKLRFLDVCPADYALVDRLAPELVSPSQYVALRSGDSALDAMCRAAGKVTPDTPWSDERPEGRTASGWSTFARAAPLKQQPDWFLRRRPFDDVGSGAQEAIEDMGRRLGRDVLPRYDEALAILDAAIADFEAGRDKASHPRSVANLYLSRFWFAMSAFHLDALGIYAREVERFIPDSMKGHVDTIYITYVPTIRMSDVLAAYDGRELAPAAEDAYRRWIPENAPGYQGNLLEIDAEDPNYRARRALDRVLLYLDPRLRHRALDMIASGKRVMERYAKTGWGWTTYYSDAYTFIFKPVPVSKGHHPMPGDSTPQPPRPTTPTPPGGATTPGGSAPGGPTTR